MSALIRRIACRRNKALRVTQPRVGRKGPSSTLAQGTKRCHLVQASREVDLQGRQTGIPQADERVVGGRAAAVHPPERWKGMREVGGVPGMSQWRAGEQQRRQQALRQHQSGHQS